MSVSLTVNGVAFPYPQTGDPAPWGDGVQQWASAVTTGMLQKAGGNFTLTADVNFGPNFGLLSQYFTSRSANAAAAGVARFSNTDTINFRNFAASADNSLGTNVSDRLTYNTVAVPTISSTDTLTNKTMSGAANTLSNIAYSSLTLGGNIVNADINAAAAIAYSKLALTGAVQNADLAAAVSIAKGGTGQTAQTAGFDALAPTTTKGDIIVRGASNNVRLAIGSDGQVPVADATATNGLAWKTLQQGAKNYITYNNFENNSTTGWSLGNAGTLTNGIPTGTPTFGSGNSGTLSMAVVSSGQLAGSYSLSYVSSAATTLADMLASQAYTIDIEDQAKVLSFKFYYKAFSGAANCNFSGTSSNSFGVAVYDVTNSAWLGTAGQFSMVQSSGVGICQGTFQTGSTTASIRLVVYNITATSGAATMYLDDFYVGPQALAFGPAMSDWAAYTPTLTSSGGGNITLNATGVTNPNAYWRRVGDSIELCGSLKNGSGGGATGTAGNITISLPSGLTPDYAKLETSVSGSNIVGSCTYGTSDAVGSSHVSGSALRFFDSTGGTLAVSTLVANCVLDFRALLPVTGWSSNTVMSADSDTRVVAMRTTLTTAQTAVASKVIPFNSATLDTHSGLNTSTGRYTIPVSGYYRVKAHAKLDSMDGATNALIAIYKNGAEYSRAYTANLSATTASVMGNIEDVLSLNAGDYVEIYASGDASFDIDSNSGRTVFSIQRLSGPAVVAATESVNARMYLSTASATVPATSFVPFDTVTYDSHSACTVGVPASLTGAKFTAPVSGKYAVKACLDSASALWAANNSTTLAIHVNGSGTSSSFIGANAWAALTTDISSSISDTVKLNAGDYVQIKWTHNRASATAISGSTDGRTFIAIERVGN